MRQKEQDAKQMIAATVKTFYYSFDTWFFFFLTIIVQQICFNPRSAWIDCERMDNAKLDIRNICKPLFA